jgi:hypothetical protein
MPAEVQEMTPAATQAAGETAAAATERATTQTSESAAEGEQESQEQTEGGEPRPKVTGGFQKRIDKLTREKEFYKELALRGGIQPQQQQQTTQQTETATAAATDASKPKAADFETHAEFVEALVDWKADLKLRTIESKQATDRARTQQQTAQQAYQAKEKEYSSAVPDFDEVVAAADFPVSAAVVEEITHGENGPALKYYLAQNPEEADRLSKLTPVALAREVGRLEPRFKTAAGKPAAAPVSKAPPPISTAARSTSTSTKDPGEMSPREYREWRQKTHPNLR